MSLYDDDVMESKNDGSTKGEQRLIEWRTLTRFASDQLEHGQIPSNCFKALFTPRNFINSSSNSSK